MIYMKNEDRGTSHHYVSYLVGSSIPSKFRNIYHYFFVPFLWGKHQFTMAVINMDHTTTQEQGNNYYDLQLPSPRIAPPPPLSLDVSHTASSFLVFHYYKSIFSTWCTHNFNLKLAVPSSLLSFLFLFLAASSSKIFHGSCLI